MNNPPVYYVTRAPSGGLELRQTRFRNVPNHPHDVCAVACTVEEMQGMISRHLTGGVDWSAVTTQATPPKHVAKPIPDCPYCGGEREMDGRGGFACYHCGRSTCA